MRWPMFLVVLKITPFNVRIAIAPVLYGYMTDDRAVARQADRSLTDVPKHM